MPKKKTRTSLSPTQNLWKCSPCRKSIGVNYLTADFMKSHLMIVSRSHWNTVVTLGDWDANPVLSSRGLCARIFRRFALFDTIRRAAHTIHDWGDDLKFVIWYAGLMTKLRNRERRSTHWSAERIVTRSKAPQRNGRSNVPAVLYGRAGQSWAADYGAHE